MLTILYSFNKTGYEAEFWEREIAAAAGPGWRFVPFNHGRHVDPRSCARAQLLDALYFANDPALLRLYRELQAALRSTGAQVLLVDTCPPYHPEYLRQLPVYKVLRIADGPLAAYDRDFAYLHAYDQVLYHSPAYSRDLTMAEKLRYCRAPRSDYWPLALFDAMHDTAKTEETILAGRRDVDVVFVGALFPGKMPLIAKVKKALGRRCRIYGLGGWRRNAYFNVRYGFPGWVSPLPTPAYVPLYQRAKIGFNVHNRGKYTVGGYRLFELPGNGVLQISDGGEYLEEFFRVGDEVVGYESADELVAQIRYYLEHEDERRRIALNGFRRVKRDHGIGNRLRQAYELIIRGMRNDGPNNPNATT